MRRRAVGHVVGGWHLKEFIGEGQFGQVYKAERLDSTGWAAVKLLNPSDVSPQEALTEVRRLEAVDSPYVVRLIDAGTVHTGALAGHVWLAVELCGQSLQRRLWSDGFGFKPLDSEDTQRLAQCMCDALCAAHGHLPPILHRDVKPGNILRAGRDWKLCDFGIAAVVSPDDPYYDLRERIRGTWHYMAPELFEESRAGRSADIYALGATIHEALLGVVPSPLRQSESQLDRVKRMIRDGPELSPDIPSQWQPFVKAACAPKPDRPSAQQLAELIPPVRWASSLATAPTEPITLAEHGANWLPAVITAAEPSSAAPPLRSTRTTVLAFVASVLLASALLLYFDYVTP
jgi:eukaryotic-like serine/threonine-protein kinase